MHAAIFLFRVPAACKMLLQKIDMDLFFHYSPILHCRFFLSKRYAWWQWRSMQASMGVYRLYTNQTPHGRPTCVSECPIFSFSIFFGSDYVISQLSGTVFVESTLNCAPASFPQHQVVAQLSTLIHFYVGKSSTYNSFVGTGVLKEQLLCCLT